MTTSVSSVVSHFPSAQDGFTTTLGSTISSGAATVPLNSVAGYTNSEVAVFIVDPADVNKKQTFTGIVDTSGVQLTNVIWTSGTNQQHTAGATVVDYATATHISMMTKGILVEHTQAGRHTMTSPKVITDISDTNGNELLKVTATASAVNELTLANAATGNNPTVTASGGDTNVGMNFVPKGTGKFQIGGNPVDHGAWASWTPTWTNLTVGNGTVTAKYAQVGKTIRARIHLVCGTTTSKSGEVSFTLPTTPLAEHYGHLVHPIGTALWQDFGTTTFGGAVYFNGATTATVRYYRSDTTQLETAVASAGSPMTFAANDSLGMEITYESA